MFDIILALNENNGIGRNGVLPWHCPEDLKIFRQKTKNHILIVGRKTAETLPKLKDRTIFYVGKTDIKQNNDYTRFDTLQEALNYSKTVYPDKKIFVAGGAILYKTAFTEFVQFIDNIHVSRIKDYSECDTYFDFMSYINTQNWIVQDRLITVGSLCHYTLERDNTSEQSYLELLQKVYSKGKIRDTRNGKTRSLFFDNLSFDLRDGFPLLTTKKMFLRGIFEELMFFIRGDTDGKILEQKGVNIWRGNTTREFLDKLDMKNRPEGVLGPMYGYQWRHFNASYDEVKATNKEPGYDQLRHVIETIKNDPMSRRIIMTDFNPLQATQGVLYPCHSIVIQFYVSGQFLDMSCYNRSQDLFLGTPFNIASSALLLTLVAKLTGYTPRNLHMSLGDVHIYESHTDAVLSQIKRKPFSYPKLIIDKKIDTLETLEKLVWDDVKLLDYKHHEAIQAPMVA
jgi:thymidylate synthase